MFTSTVMIRMMRCRCKIIQSKKIAVFLFSSVVVGRRLKFPVQRTEIFNRLSPKKEKKLFLNHSDSVGNDLERF